nr:hypothetical protein [Tanacetum cinerariifolium]
TESLNGVNFLDWESKLRTLLTATNELKFIDGPWPQKPNPRAEDPRLTLVYDMVPELHMRGTRMNEEKFGTYEAMDGYASWPNVEEEMSVAG